MGQDDAEPISSTRMRTTLRFVPTGVIRSRQDGSGTFVSQASRLLNEVVRLYLESVLFVS